MQTINVSQLAEGANDMHVALIPKMITILGMTSATGFLTAYSTDIGSAASALPQVINFIGTHGPIMSLSWADCIAIMSGCLVALNLIFAIQKAFTMVSGWFKKPRKRSKRNV